jgi:phosphate uptake regulator
VLKCLIDEKDITVKEALDRMCSLTLQMLRNVGDNEKVALLEQELDKFYFLSLRVLRKIMADKSQWKKNDITNPQDITSLMLIFDSLEDIGDHILELKSIPKTLEEDMTETYDNIRKKDVILSNNLITKLKERLKTYKETTPHVRILGHLMGMLEWIIDLSLTHTK